MFDELKMKLQVVLFVGPLLVARTCNAVKPFTGVCTAARIHCQPLPVDGQVGTLQRPRCHVVFLSDEHHGLGSLAQHQAEYIQPFRRHRLVDIIASCIRSWGSTKFSPRIM